MPDEAAVVPTPEPVVTPPTEGGTPASIPDPVVDATSTAGADSAHGDAPLQIVKGYDFSKEEHANPLDTQPASGGADSASENPSGAAISPRPEFAGTVLGNADQEPAADIHEEVQAQNAGSGDSANGGMNEGEAAAEDRDQTAGGFVSGNESGSEPVVDSTATTESTIPAEPATTETQGAPVSVDPASAEAPATPEPAVAPTEGSVADNAENPAGPTDEAALASARDGLAAEGTAGAPVEPATPVEPSPVVAPDPIPSPDGSAGTTPETPAQVESRWNMPGTVPPPAPRPGVAEVAPKSMIGAIADRVKGLLPKGNAPTESAGTIPTTSTTSTLTPEPGNS